MSTASKPAPKAARKAPATPVQTPPAPTTRRSDLEQWLKALCDAVATRNPLTVQATAAQVDGLLNGCGFAPEEPPAKVKG